MRIGEGFLMGTYSGDSARGSDGAHRPAGLSQSVSEHGDQDLSIIKRKKNQLLRASN
jgi:hypothetical protein